MRCDRGGAPYFLGLIVFIVPVDALIDLFWADEIGCIWAGERMATMVGTHVDAMHYALELTSAAAPLEAAWTRLRWTQHVHCLRAPTRDAASAAAAAAMLNVLPLHRHEHSRVLTRFVLLLLGRVAGALQKYHS